MRSVDVKKVNESERMIELGDKLADAVVQRDRGEVRRLMSIAARTPVGLERARSGLLGAALADLVELVEVSDGPGADTDSELQVKRDKLRVDTRLKLVALLMGEAQRGAGQLPGSAVQVNIGLDGLLAQVQARRSTPSEG